MKNLRGQSFFEVVVAIGLISIILITLVAMGSASIKASVFSRNQTGATRYSQQATEWLRAERDASFAAFKTKALTLNWCLDSLYWLKPGSCSTTDIITGTVFTRAMKFTNIDANTIQAEISTVWKDADGDHTVATTTYLTNWGSYIAQTGATPAPTPAPTSTATPLPTPTPLPTGTPIPAALAWWKFDEGSGTTVSDSIGGFTGTWVGSGSHWAAGQINQAGNFPGADYVPTTHTFNATGSPAYSLCNWFRETSQPPATYAGFIGTGAFTGTRNGVVSGIKTGGVAYVDTYGTEWNPYSSFALNTWYHVCLTSNGSTQSYYVNGAFVTSRAEVSAFSPGSTVIGYAKFPGRYFAGQIDEARFYNYALTTPQVQYVYTGGAAPTPTPTSTPIPAAIASWNFNENSGTTVADSIGGNTGTWNGASSHWTTGIAGSAGNFAATNNDYVFVPNNVLFNPLGTFTISMWIKRAVLTTSLPRIINQAADANNFWAITVPQSSGVSDTNAAVLSLRIGGSQVDRKTPDGTLGTAGVWYHIVAQWAGTTIQAIYVNNVSQTLSTVLNTYTFGSTAGLFIGNRNDGIRGFDGQIDAVKIFTYTLTPAQISYLYNNPGI